MGWRPNRQSGDRGKLVQSDEQDYLMLQPS
jgi:hypothetical protein